MQEKFKEHERVHTEEKPFACNKCDHELMMQEEFKKHERVQTEEKSIACKMTMNL